MSLSHLVHELSYNKKMKMSHWYCYSAFCSSVVRVESQTGFWRQNPLRCRQNDPRVFDKQQMSKHCLFLNNKIVQIKRRILLLHHVS